MRKNEIRQITVLVVIVLFSLIVMIAFVWLRSSAVEVYNVTNNVTVTAEKYVENKININTASPDELQNIAGIGEVIANRIVDYRSDNGSFESVYDIVAVKGISQNLFEKIRPYITV